MLARARANYGQKFTNLFLSAVQVLLLLVLLVTLALGQRQRDCAQQGENRLLNPTTSMTSLQMTCSVDPGAEVSSTEQFLWE